MNWKELLNLTVKVDAIWRGYEDGGNTWTTIFSGFQKTFYCILEVFKIIVYFSLLKPV